MDDFFRDIRHSLRMFRQTPGFTLAAIAALTLGIGANTAIFSVVNSVLLKPLPFPNPERLVVFLNTGPNGGGPGASVPKFLAWREPNDALQDAAAYRLGVMNLIGTLQRDSVFSRGYQSIKLGSTSTPEGSGFLPTLPPPK